MLVQSTNPAERKDRSRDDWLPWAWCNLRRNPFGELLPEERVKLAVVDVDVIQSAIRGPGTAVQLIGECGRGKTTRMLVLSHLFDDSAYVYLPEDERCPAIPVGDPLLIDEAQRLPRSIRRQVFASGLPLVLATHRDLRRPLRRAGYEVTTHQIGQSNGAELVHRILNRRIESSRLDPAGPVPELSPADAAALVARFGSDVRAMEGYLYEVVQAQVFSDGEMRFID